MKTFKITLLAALISSPLAAETFGENWEAGVFVDYIKSSTNKDGVPEWKNISAGKGYGIDLQKIINEQWNARLELAATYYDIDHAHDIDFATRIGVDAIYKVEETDLYLFTGVKRFNNARSYNAVNVGAGYNYKINNRFTVYGEAAIYRDINNGYTDQGLKLGLKYTYGEEAKSPARKVSKQASKQASNKSLVANEASLVNSGVFMDSDNDGVNDKTDRCVNTSANAKVDAFGCPIYVEKEVAVNLHVPFEHNSSELAPSTVNDIQRLADFMKQYNNTSVVIEGHTSAVGAEKYNLKLSQKRADKVKNTLVDQFTIDTSRLSAVGFGETQLITTGNTEADHKLNRRVVSKITATVKEEVKKD